jgi:Lar family restriction alleviation protein
MTSTDQVELLPCPFCGGEAKRFTIGDDEPNNAGGDVICCTRCQASSHVEFGRKENLVSLWNTRAAIAAVGDEWRTEPTEAMIDAGMKAAGRYGMRAWALDKKILGAVYRAMIEARPLPKAPDVTEKEKGE